MPAYDPNNLFAKILRGDLPCYKVYEDDKALAFLDIMPRATGHTLVIPKAPARTILDIAPRLTKKALTRLVNDALLERLLRPAALHVIVD